MENVAITGMGVISSIGSNIDEVNRNLAEAHVAVQAAPWAGEAGLDYAWVSLVEGFKPEDWMDQKVIEGTDPFAWYAIAAAEQAVAESGLTDLDPRRTAVILGTALGGMETIAASQHGLDTVGVEGASRKMQLQALPSMAASQIAMRWDLHGPLLTLSTACASAHDAIGTAARMIEAGMVDVAIAGAADSARCKIQILTMGLYRMFTQQPDPYKACLPFDVNRTGVMPGEGAGMLVLERADRARARGATIHGRIRGYGSMADAYHPSSPEPDGKWEQVAMEDALADADLPGGVDQVDALFAHGTGTHVGDIAEAKAINRLFAGHDTPLPVASVKGHLGHTAGAAGVFSLFGGMASMQANAVIPNAGTRDVDPVVEFNAVIKEPFETKVETIQVNAFGFGGQNASMIVTQE
ncbi:MAG: beta-ketoacyl-[acyl-carrier-protein] synthase family protein [Alphaproteobacteria bacterium]|jgi:3-oxoacyl-[acyl-carrier-protein] synthase II|nr:beta-ketoacyl-[acyl-carrier-protein] synthase family protein [Alphaproteobacteria bacterium]MDP6564828.1 beta-ketoacyl-[acyl-carrier-protein] synthase family protein [Alphaproteobacteria bacterium]MDP6814482.1 beta-ketoacyl-[acyl-carrier-protein] synthase family protein [Alphaproteobacteria bacterium]